MARACGSSLLGLLCGCSQAPDAAGPDLKAPWQQGESGADYYADTSARLQPGARHVIWFGHSLLVTRDGWGGTREPALDLPRLVAELHRAALADGRTTVPSGRSLTFAEGPYGFAYWLSGEGDARGKLEAVRAVPWTDVVAIDLMHLLGQSRFDSPDLYEWAGPLVERGTSVRSRTRDVYRFIGLAHALLPAARWINYVGPALANNPGVQPAIEARFACIRERARAAGVAVANAPVGQAFRMAEARARERGLTLRLQHDDFLHLRPQGAVLAAYVLYLTIYGVDPTGLPLPERYAGMLAGDREREIIDFLAEIAVHTVAHHRPACAPGALVREDRRAARWLTP